MEMNDVLLSRIGTVVTILCAIGSLVGWLKSRRAATQAESAVRQIQYHRSVRQAGTVHAALNSAIKSLRTVGLGCNAEKIVGIKMEPIIEETELFLELFQAAFADPQLAGKINVHIDDFTFVVRRHISLLSDAVSAEDKLKESRQIYLKLSSLQPGIGRIADEFTFNPKGD
ncbi:hypothetical protein DW184_24615 [Enterobacter cloacae]|uniref:hypothetical protein n=1 Tax=Enterobacter cloacae TaxID=550 RepID=UPI000E471DE6|nr:hypothetical protein [Enterobacter cloacae]RHH96547.1 hypothetical protein DW184_24615 [Enterobacter cloacae]